MWALIREFLNYSSRFLLSPISSKILDKIKSNILELIGTEGKEYSHSMHCGPHHIILKKDNKSENLGC